MLIELCKIKHSSLPAFENEQANSDLDTVREIGRQKVLREKRASIWKYEWELFIRSFLPLYRFLIFSERVYFCFKNSSSLFELLKPILKRSRMQNGAQLN